jgi:hypothetical protein
MIDAFIIIFGLSLVVGGVVAVRKKKATSDYGVSEGEKAVLLGYFWIILGAAALLGALFDIHLFKNLITTILGVG